MRVISIQPVHPRKDFIFQSANYFFLPILGNLLPSQAEKEGEGEGVLKNVNLSQ